MTIGDVPTAFLKLHMSTSTHFRACFPNTAKRSKTAVRMQQFDGFISGL
jgi:hypothetical protein